VLWSTRVSTGSWRRGEFSESVLFMVVVTQSIGNGIVTICMNFI
jgi:hypothetical protein